ncbi:MAG TPA: hypothetical protein VIR55_13540 [Ignavibacteria bacterium]
MKSFFSVLFLSLLIINCSSEKKSKSIIGNWVTVNNVNNSKIKMSITDSTILAEFWFDEGIKKIQYKYIIEEEKDSSLIIKTTNYFKIESYDTILLNLPLITFSPQGGEKIILRKMD